MTPSVFGLAVGFLGELLFTSCFLVQWMTSERFGRSIVPGAFLIRHARGRSA